MRDDGPPESVGMKRRRRAAPVPARPTALRIHETLPLSLRCALAGSTTVRPAPAGACT
jgi:hypothetical protein